MKKYELKYTVGEDGVFAMSTVTSPAVLSTLVMFSNETELLQFSDDEKKIIYSVAMRPNMLIPRKNINGEPAEVFYSEETVKDLQQNFFKMNYHNGGTVNHGGVLVKDMYFFESWIVEDPTKDKATSLGLDVKKGDWVLGQKIDNAEVWEKVKNKELLGFSIEAFLNPILTNDNTIEMTKEEIDARIKEVILMTAEEDAAKKKEEEEAAAKLAMAEGDPMPPAEEPKADLQKQVDDLTAENISLKASIAEMEGKAIEMASEVAASKKVAIEMGEEMAKGIKPKAPSKNYEEMSALERFRDSKNK
jgi:hypothetical protein